MLKFIKPKRQIERPSVIIEQCLVKTVQWYLDNEDWLKPLQKRYGVGELQSLQIASPYEVVYKIGWIKYDELKKIAHKFGKSTHNVYLGPLAGSPEIFLEIS